MSEHETDKKNTIKHQRGFSPLVIKGIIAVVAICLLGAIAKMGKKEQEIQITDVPLVNVSVLDIASESNVPDTFTIPATVEPNQTVVIAAEISGRIERVRPREGELVDTDQLLIELNTDLILPQVAIAEAQVHRDRILYDRLRGLIEQNAASKQDLDDAASALAVSQASLDEVRARLERCRIFAPVSGVLNDLFIEEGEYVDPGGRVARIVQTNPVKVVAEVPERDIHYFSTGQPAQVLVEDTDTPTTLTGTITYISELADNQSRTTRMEITIDNTEKRIRSGQLVKVRLTRRFLEKAIFIPLLAVIPMEDTYSVYVVDADTARRKTVTLGMIKEDRILVLEGLVTGDQLIVSGHRFVASGQKVNIVNPTQE